MHIPTPSLIHLLHELPAGVLSTLSLQMPGYPFGTAVPLVLDEAHQPLLLISALAEHTRNLLADPRASLAVVDTRLSQVLDGPRASLVGPCLPFSPSGALVERYLRYQPAAAQYLTLDFAFFRLQVEQVRYIGGVGQMGWITSDQLGEARQLSLEAEAALLADLDAHPLPGIRCLGVDPYGLDYEQQGLRRRHGFGKPLAPEEIASALTAWRKQLAAE